MSRVQRGDSVHQKSVKSATNGFNLNFTEIILLRMILIRVLTRASLPACRAFTVMQPKYLGLSILAVME